MKRAIIFISAAVILLFVQQSAHAFGLGVYGTGGVGWNKWFEDEGNIGGNFYNFGGGFTLDTNLAMDRVFSYRLKVGAEYLGTPNISVNWTRVHIINTFGFGAVRTKVVRFWLGPEIIFGPIFGSNRWGFVGGMGLALGLNINIGNVFTLGFTWSGRVEGGYRQYTVTKILNSDIQSFILTRNALALIPDRYQYTTGGVMIYGQFDICFMFRIHDKYGK